MQNHRSHLLSFESELPFTGSLGDLSAHWSLRSTMKKSLVVKYWRLFSLYIFPHLFLFFHISFMLRKKITKAFLGAELKFSILIAQGEVKLLSVVLGKKNKANLSSLLCVRQIRAEIKPKQRAGIKGGVKEPWTGEICTHSEWCLLSGRCLLSRWPLIWKEWYIVFLLSKPNSPISGLI